MPNQNNNFKSPLVIQKKYDTPLSELFANDDDNDAENDEKMLKSFLINSKNSTDAHRIEPVKSQLMTKNTLTYESPTTQKIIIDSQLENLMSNIDSQPKKLIPGSIKMTVKQPSSIATKETVIKTETNVKTNSIVKSNINFGLNDLNFDSDDDEVDSNKLLNVNSHNNNAHLNTVKEIDVKMKNRLEHIKFECHMKSPSSENQKTNSTSTPRSILKNNQVKTEISYSPLVLSQTQSKIKKQIKFEPNEHENKFTKENQMQKSDNLNISVVGMTQALDLLMSPGASIKHESDTNLIIKPCFNMKSTLDDLFTEEDLIDAEFNSPESKTKQQLKFGDACLPKDGELNYSPIEISSREESKGGNSTEDSIFVSKKVMIEIIYDSSFNSFWTKLKTH
jgi:hypothetical protein